MALDFFFFFLSQLVLAKLLQSCLTLCDPMDCSPPGSSVHGILQTRIPEWVAMPSSRESSRPKDLTRVSYVSCIGRGVLYHWHLLGSGETQFQKEEISAKQETEGSHACLLSTLSPLSSLYSHVKCETLTIIETI